MTTLASVASNDRAQTTEWTTFGLIVGCYGAWMLCTTWLAVAAPVLAVLLTGIAVAFHASLTHEVLHGHPFRSKALNEALMFPSLNLVIPYERFRDLHLAHHRDSNLTDPYDDPETNYLDPAVWSQMPRWKQALFRVNNTLAGRILFGAAIGQALFVQSEWAGARAGDRAILRAWLLHGVGAGLVLAWVALTPMPVWAYLISAYCGLSLLRIRTFLEHQAHERVRGRTVIIEDRGPLSWLFLNNNLHVVHHMHPGEAWYRLPALYRANRQRYLGVNEGYFYGSYGEVFRRHFWRAKDPVPHPHWPKP